MNAPVAQFALILQLVSTIRSSKIENIDLSMWFKISDGDVLPLLDGLEWRALEEALDSKVFARLKGFRIDVFPNCDFLPVSYFSSRLPKLDKREILTSPHLELKGQKLDKGKTREEPRQD